MAEPASSAPPEPTEEQFWKMESTISTSPGKLSPVSIAPPSPKAKQPWNRLEATSRPPQNMIAPPYDATQSRKVLELTERSVLAVPIAPPLVIALQEMNLDDAIWPEERGSEMA